jgi:hypothetical protein
MQFGRNCVLRLSAAEQLMIIKVVDPRSAFAFYHKFIFWKPQDTLEAILADIPGQLDEPLEIASQGRWSVITKLGSSSEVSSGADEEPQEPDAGESS